MSLLLLKPRSPSIIVTIFLIVSEKGIATSETQKPTQQLHTVDISPRHVGSYLGPVLSKTLWQVGSYLGFDGFDGCHPSHQLEFLALGEDCHSHAHI
jgi:hypothetical protein